MTNDELGKEISKLKGSIGKIEITMFDSIKLIITGDVAYWIDAEGHVEAKPGSLTSLAYRGDQKVAEAVKVYNEYLMNIVSGDS